MKYRHLLLLALSTFILNASGQGRPPIAPSPQKAEQLQSFKFEGADLDTIMTQYCAWTGKIYLKTDAVKATITLKADRLTTTESIKVVEAILAMNNIALVPMGDRYIKVVPATAGDLTGQGLKINMDPNKKFTDSENFITTIIQLKNVQIQEVQAAIQHILHSFGKILTLERSNSIMITDTESNIKRVRELIEFIDQATAQIEPRIYQIQYADASEIASKLNEIVTAAQGDQKTPTAANPYARTPPGVIRARTTKSAPTQATISKTEASNTLIIQGTVKIMADERTNIIIIFSQEENFEFFDKIIKVLDVVVEPAINFEVVNLEYADAEELSGTLNDLVGAATGSRSSSSSNTSRTSSPPTSRPSNTSRVTPKASQTSAIQNLSRLSENTKILADKRSNSILLMGEKSDIAAIKNVIASLDIMLEQVLIEAAIFEVTLGDELEHGLQWLYENQKQEQLGSWDGVGLVTGVVGNVASGALTYYQGLAGIDSKIAIKLAADDSNVRLLATPVIMTTDNTEAKLSIGEQRPVVTSTETSINSSNLRSAYEYKDIGIQLTVTPRINPQRVVIMEILQKADQVGDEVVIDGNPVPVILNREFEAQIAVPDRGTIALGGLINSESRDTVSKIPILGDIPLIGRYLFSSVSKKHRQTELIVLMTPYVLTTPDEMLKETERLYDSIDMQLEDWPEGNWSDTPLKHRPKPDPEGIEPEVQENSSKESKPQATTPAEKDDLILLLDEMGK